MASTNPQRLALTAVVFVFIAVPALGQSGALYYDTVGPSPPSVVPPGYYALSIDGDFQLEGHVFKDGSPFIHNDGGSAYNNTALGLHALNERDTGGAHVD